MRHRNVYHRHCAAAGPRLDDRYPVDRVNHQRMRMAADDRVYFFSEVSREVDYLALAGVGPGGIAEGAGVGNHDDAEGGLRSPHAYRAAAAGAVG